MSNGLDADQDRRSVDPDRGSKYFQKGSVDDEKSPVTVLPARLTVASCFVFKAIRDLESIDHLLLILSAG